MRKSILKIILFVIVITAATLGICACSGSKYTLVFNTYGGGYITPITETSKNLETLELPQAEREGYTFEGWYLDEELTEAYTPGCELSGTVTTLYAKYTVNTYTLTVHDGENSTAYTYNYGDELQISLPESSASRLFTGWYTEEDCTERFTSSSMPSYDVDIYAGWADGSYVLIYDSGSDFIEPEIYTYTELCSLTTIDHYPYKEDYVFMGWYLDEDRTVEFSSEYDFDYPIIVLYAKYTPIEYTVEIVSNYANSYECLSGSSTQTVSVEDSYIPVEISALTGYTYQYYELDGEIYYSDTITIKDKITSDVKVYVYLDYATYELPIVAIEADGDINSKTEYTSMSFSLSNCDNELNSVSGGIRLRGNSTMGYDKKPYRIKFDKKQSLFGLTKAKSWVLLADYLDPSTLHNVTAFTLGNASDELSFTPTAFKVNVYINGEFMGLYTLCEQVQENEGRMDIEMETDADGYLPETLTDLSDYNFFIAMDYSVIGDSDSVLNETYYYIEKYGLYFELKYPEKEAFRTEEQFRSFFSQLVEYTEYILDIMTEGTLDEIKSSVNVYSLADYFLIDNIMGEHDHNIKSFNMYYVASSDNQKQSGKLNFGPIWDYDWSLSTPWTGSPNETFSTYADGLEYQGNYYFLALGRFDELKELVKERYNSCFKQTLGDYIDGYDDLVASISESLALNNEKWYSGYDYDITQANIDFLKQFLTDRKTWLDNYFST
ncbi:MAG: CotH kinase family protein [Clostridia bacterium]|nr:CotH kinase family protein [Clostridia bacterium]